MSNFQRPGGAKPATSPAPQTQSAQPAKPRYAGAASIKIGVESNYLRPGAYLAMIERVETGRTTTKNEDFVSVKLTILAADDSTLSGEDRQFGRGLHRVGETASWFVKESGPTALYFEQNMLKFAIVAWNLTQEEIAEIEQANGVSFIDSIKKGEGLAGVVVELQATMRQNAESKKANQPATADNLNTFPKWIRRLPYAEVKELVPADVLAKFLPDIEAKIKAEATS
jgi:hypothetical protein